MIELRPRKLARRHLSVGGSDRPEASEEGDKRVGEGDKRVGEGDKREGESAPQLQGESVKKRRGRPRLSAPVQGSGETGTGVDKASSKVDGLRENGPPHGQVKGLKLKLVRVPPPCASGDVCQPKKRGRKPKVEQNVYEIPAAGEGQSCVTAVANGGITAVSVETATDANQQINSAQNNVATAQVKKRGRKPKIQPSVKCEDLETGESVYINDIVAVGGSNEQVEVSVCSGPRKKRGRKAGGSLLWKNIKGVKRESPCEEVEGVSCTKTSKIHTLQVRVQRSLISHVPRKTAVSSEHLKCTVKNLQSDLLHGGEKVPSKTESRHSRRTKHADPISNVEQRKIPVVAEENTNCLMTSSEQSSVLKEKEKNMTSESSATKCSAKVCHVHSPDLPNPVVRLRSCKNLQVHSYNKRPVGPGSILTTQNEQNQISLIDSVASDSASSSAVGNRNHSEKVAESTSVVNNKTPTKTILKVKFNFRKREPQNTSNIELKSINCRAKELEHDDNQHEVGCRVKSESSTSQSETLMDKLNNNTIIATVLNPTNEQNEVGSSPICNTWDNWRIQAPFVSDEEIGDYDLVKSSNIAVCSSQAKEDLAITCQRVVPFTGKSIWKCSCARTYVSVLPQKRPADVRNTVILGIEAERSLEIYSDAKPSLFVSSSGQSIQGKTEEEDSEAVCKKRKLDLYIESTSPRNLASYDSTLNESPSGENKDKIESLLITSETSDTSVSLPLASEPSRKKCDLECSECPVQNNEQMSLQREAITHVISEPPSRTEAEIDQKNVTNPVFKIPNEEPRAFLHEDVPLVGSTGNDLKIEICSVATPLEEVNTIPNDNLKSSYNNCDSEDSQPNYCPSESCDKVDSVTREDICDTEITLTPTSTKKPSNTYKLDLLKAYEEDALVLDVVQDDPELYDFSIRGERSSPKTCNTNKNVTSRKRNKMAFVYKVQKKSVLPRNKSKTCQERIQSAPERSTDLVHDFFDVTSAHQDTCSNSLPETADIQTHAEMKESGGPTESQDKQASPEELHLASMLDESDESENSPVFREVLPFRRLPLPQQAFFHHQKPESFISNSLPPLMHDFHSNAKGTYLPDVVAPDSMERWKHEKAVPPVQYSCLPTGYCRYFFNTFNGCTNTYCRYLHVPRKCDEKICMDVLRKLLNEKSTLLLKRAVWIFTEYYSQRPPSLHYDIGIFGALFHPLLNLNLWQDLFHLLETAATAKIFPSLDQIINVFKKAAFSGFQPAFSTLLDIFCKFVHNGMNITPVEIGHIIAVVSKSSAAKQHINILLSMKSSLEMKTSRMKWSNTMEAAMSEIEHCKVNSDWMKLGTMYLNICTGCENLTNLNNFSRVIAEALMKDAISEKPEIPYCEFADAIFKNPQFDDIQKNILGRIGISVMFFYHRKELWIKGRKVICKIHELQINYTVLRGLFGKECEASRCHVVNIAAEIFLKCGNLSGAVQTLKESDWIISTPMWPCNMMDVLHRHNLMCVLLHEALPKNMFALCFEVLQNLPGFQGSQADLSVSQYTGLYNKVLNSCVENRSIGICTSMIDFMIDKKIAIDYSNLRAFITTLGHSTLWTKARGYYKSAMALGFYPPFEGKLNPNILAIPSFMSDVEMLMTIEHFMVSNASSIQSKRELNQTFQIVLKRMEEDSAACKDSYHAANEKLLEASRLSTPKLFIKHLTVNNTNEQVYILDNSSILKWLNENMKWAGNTWHSH